MNIDILQRLVAAHGISGNETEIRDVIAQISSPYVDEVSTDVMGNLILHKRGTGPKLMFAAHMDTIGLVVTHIEQDGMLRFSGVGGLDAKNLRCQRMEFISGLQGVIGVCGNIRENEPELSDLYLDIGAENREDAEKYVCVSDTCRYLTTVTVRGNRIISPYLDNRVGCYVLLEALMSLERGNNDLYFVFTVQEEVGLRGAKPASFAVAPDYAVAVDVTRSDDRSTPDRKASAKLGCGAAVKIMDSSVICHPGFVKHIEEVAHDLNIPVQRDVITSGGTDAGVMISSGAGAVTGGISVPCRYPHTAGEMCDIRDIEACVRLVAALAESELIQQ